MRVKDPFATVQQPLPRSGGITLRSASSVPTAQWDALVEPGALFASHAWVRHLAEAAGPDPILTVRSEDELAAVVPMWSAGKAQGSLFDLSKFFGDLGGPWSQPWAWLGARRSVHNTLPCVSGLSRSWAQARVLEAAARHAATNGMAGVIMPYMPLHSADEMAAARPDAQVLLHAVEATAQVPSADPNPVGTGTRGRHNRKRRRQEWARFREAGYVIEEAGLDAVADEAADLITNTRRKYGAREDSGWMRRVFAAQHQVGLTDHAVALVCRRSTRMVAVAVCYQHGRTLFGRYYGASESPGSGAPVYFVMTSQAPLAYAASVGLDTVNLSTSSLEAKVRRGARLSPLAAVVLPTVDHAIDRSQARLHNKGFAASYRTQFPDALTSEWRVELG